MTGIYEMTIDTMRQKTGMVEMALLKPIIEISDNRLVKAFESIGTRIHEVRMEIQHNT